MIRRRFMALLGLGTACGIGATINGKAHTPVRSSLLRLRVSCREDDPGYRTFLAMGGPGLTVYCDGERLQKVHTADAWEGKAWGYAYDPSTGTVQVLDDRSGCVPIEYRGSITFGRIPLRAGLSRK